MLTENLNQELQTCNHERSHFGLDAAYCPDCKRQFRPRSKEYQQLLHQPFGIAQGKFLVLNHPDPRPGDRVTLLGDRPSRIYEILKVDDGHAICKPIDGEGTRKAAYWKLRAYCSVEQVSGAVPPPPAPDTPPVEQVSGADPSPAAPDTKSSGWLETYQPNGRKTQYFRYLWRDRGKLQHVHLPGGNIKDAKALAVAASVKDAIAAGKSPTEILELIRSFRSGTQHQER